MKWLFAVLMLAGVGMTFIPVLPGVLIVYGAGLVYGLIKGWSHVGASFLVGGGLLVALSFWAEHYLKAWGARRFGASRGASWGAIIGGIVGAFFFPIGLVVGPFLGAFLPEIIQGRRTEDAVRAGVGGVVGVLSGLAGNVLISVTLLIWFVITAS